MHKNPHFRVLALTATPGKKLEDVQELCDALHISHIEIRDESSPDLKQYIFQKVCFVVSYPPERFVDLRTFRHQEIEQHIVNMNDEILPIRSLLAGLMEVLHSLVALRWVSKSRAVSRLSECSRVTASFWVTRIPSSCILSVAKQKPRPSSRTYGGRSVHS